MFYPFNFKMNDSKYKFEVIVGTYEQFIVGYKFIKENGEKKFIQSFANHAHQASVKSVANSGKWLASSGNDETIHIYDMITRKQSGSIMVQNGTVTCVAFTPDSSHLLSTSEDGSISIFRTGSWQMEKIWKSAHNGAGVTCVAVHPTGKMALSLGKDLTLRTWNLVKGRPAYTTNLSRSGCRILDSVVWAPGGDFYAIPMNTSLELFSVNIAGVCHVYRFKKRITTVSFSTDKVLCVGEEDGSISAHSTSTGLEFWRISCEKRVRGLVAHKKHLIIACSDGQISAYRMKEAAEEPTLLASINAGCRITCMTVCSSKIRHIKKEVEREEETTNQDVVVENKKETVDSVERLVNGRTKKRKRKETIHPSPDHKKSGVKCTPRSQKWVVKRIKL